MTPEQLQQLVKNIKVLLKKRQPPTHEQVLKWNRNQPRGPKGSPTGGRWVKGVSAGLGSGDRAEASANYTPAPGMERFVAGVSPVYSFGSSGSREIAEAALPPTGTGFVNRPHGVGITEPVDEPASKSTKTLEVLSDGTVKDSRPLGGSSNVTVIVTMDDEDGTEAIYKPEIGETWTGSFANYHINKYIKNREFSLAQREEFAYKVGEKLFGDGNIVPTTVLREKVENVDIDIDALEDEDGDGGYDPDELQQMYDEYRQERIESGEVMDAVGEEMGRKFDEAQAEHAQDIVNRAEEMNEIWNEAIKDFPEGPYGDPEVLREHPTLPMGSQVPFERRLAKSLLDPLEVLKEANVDVSAKMNDEERARVEEVIRQKLAEGYEELGDVDDKAAREDLDRDKWYEDHAESENQLYDEQIQSFDAWKQSKGLHSYQGGGGGRTRNDEAPHPEGGSLQHFRRDSHRFGNMSQEDGVKLAVLDYVIGTMDRHDGNLLHDNDDDAPIAIDNGYSMPAPNTPDGFMFRSNGVRRWMSGNTAVSDTQRAQIAKALDETDWEAMTRDTGMNTKEQAAFLGRIENMKKAMRRTNGLGALWTSVQLM